MPDNIEQSFGIDASAALAALSQLDSGFDSLNARVSKLSQTLLQFNSTGSATAAAVKNLGSSFSSGMGQAVQSTERLTVSWGLLTRVVTVQAISARLE